MFYALAEPYFSSERAGKICFITNRPDIKVNKLTTLFYAVRSKQISIATFHCCLPTLSEIRVDFLTFIFTDYPAFHEFQMYKTCLIHDVCQDKR